MNKLKTKNNLLLIKYFTAIFTTDFSKANPLKGKKTLKIKKEAI